MSGHTPGPWKFKQARGKFLPLITTDAKVLVFKSSVTDADGTLMAAAPELLEACKALIEATQEADQMTAGMLAGCAAHMAEAAIAKATGAA